MKIITTFLFIILSIRLFSQNIETPIKLIKTSIISKDYIDVDYLNRLMLDEVNVQRLKYSLPILIVDSGLMTNSKKHSMQMDVTQIFEHSHSNLYENIFMSPVYSSTIVHETYEEAAVGIINVWMESPAHRANILNKSCKYVGISAICNHIKSPYIAHELYLTLQLSQSEYY